MAQIVAKQARVVTNYIHQLEYCRLHYSSYYLLVSQTVAAYNKTKASKAMTSSTLKSVPSDSQNVHHSTGTVIFQLIHKTRCQEKRIWISDSSLSIFSSLLWDQTVLIL